MPYRAFSQLTKANARLRQNLDEKIGQLNSHIAQSHKNCEAAQDYVERAANELESLKSLEKTRIGAIKKLTREVELLTTQVAEPVEAPDMSGVYEILVCIPLSLSRSLAEVV